VIIDLMGYLGMVLILYAYFLINKPNFNQSTLYSMLNFIGAFFIGVNCFYYSAFPSVVLNLAWMGIAIKALYKHRKWKWGLKP